MPPFQREKIAKLQDGTSHLYGLTNTYNKTHSEKKINSRHSKEFP